MSTEELKLELINRITHTENEELLNAIADFIKSFTDKGYYKMSDEQISAVREAQAQYKRGEFLSDEEADKDIEGWVKD